LESQEDLDTFLTSIESKLRGPFSSLDLAKAVTTTALRGSLTPREYLQAIAKVIKRTDKVIQSRMVIGLLGLDPSKDTNDEIYSILEQAQDDDSEEWVRVISGLIQGIMFQDSENSRESCRGKEARDLLSKTCDEIFQAIETELEKNDGDAACPDLEASFVPYRYSLISKNLLQPIMPGICGNDNPHFNVNQDAAVLKEDEQLEAQRAKEEREHQTVALTARLSSNGKATGVSSSTNGRETSLPPGFRPVKLKGAAARPKTSMFMPKKPTAGRGMGAVRGHSIARPGHGLQAKTMLRRKGTASALVKSTSMKSRTLLAKKGDSEKGGRANAMARSKMKMIDVTEVSALNKEHQKREELANSRLSKKRKIFEMAKLKGIKKMKQQESAPPAKTVPETAAAALESRVKAEAEPPQQAPSQQEEWRILLQERSNKLSDEDRTRVQQFFQNHYNPTPEQSIYKMKLHEQRTNDPNSGQAIKETFYLELDYSTFTSKQSKKVKRY